MLVFIPWGGKEKKKGTTYTKPQPCGWTLCSGGWKASRS